MIVDDEEVFRENMALFLESQGWRVFQAENGQVALDHLDDKKPALIMLDLNMSVMNGFEFLVHLQKNEQWCSTPIVILTAKTLTAEEQAHLNQHVETIFRKDILNKDNLIVFIHKLISDATGHHIHEEIKHEWE